MAHVITIPSLDGTSDRCTILKWEVKEEEEINKGKVLFTYKVNKSIYKMESPIDGVILKIFCLEGQSIVDLEKVCVIGKHGEDISKFRLGAIIQQKRKNDTEKEQAQGLKKINEAISEQKFVFKGKLNANVDRYELVRHSNMRKIIGKAMYESLSGMAQLTLNSSFDATNIMDFRKVVKEKKEKYGLNNITINDMLLYAVSRVILKHPDINAHYTPDAMHRFKNANIGVAVDSERGLLVPTLFGVNTMTLNTLSEKAKEIIESGRVGKISPDLLTGGTFTVTNLGTLGVESFTPVINPPQTAILGVCALVTKLKPDGTPYQAMGLSLTFDHRAVDGAPAARFLKDLCEYLESFTENLSLVNAVGGAL